MQFWEWVYSKLKLIIDNQLLTPFASGGVALFIDEKHNYRVLDKMSNEAFQALWIEISLGKKKNVICVIFYRQHNSPGRFQQYFDESIEKYMALDKEICILGDFTKLEL